MRMRMMKSRSPIRGRGTTGNPPTRFDRLRYEFDPDQIDPAPRTRFLRDSSRSIISYNESPDLGYEASVNPYRGCEHGCSYCYARAYHEYLGFSAGLDFETKILVKEKAPELLRRELGSPRWRPRVVSLSGVTDPYQPVERRLELTRRCLEVLAEFRNPVQITTKNHLVSRDLDLIRELARYRAAVICLSVVTLEANLSRIMEPRTSGPNRRLKAVELMAEAGIPAGVLIAPVIPGLTDHEIPAILDAAAGAGACFAGYSILRLPHGVAFLFEEWLAQHMPDRKDKILNRIRAIRGGRLHDSRFGLRLKGEGIFAEQISGLFTACCRKRNILPGHPELSTAAFRRSSSGQLALFE